MNRRPPTWKRTVVLAILISSNVAAQSTGVATPPPWDPVAGV